MIAANTTNHHGMRYSFWAHYLHECGGHTRSVTHSLSRTTLEFPLQPAAKALEHDGILAAEPADVDPRCRRSHRVGAGFGVGGKYGDLSDEAGLVFL